MAFLIKARLESQFLTTKQSGDVRQRLAACLASDAANIRPGSSGGHVAAIQGALNLIRDNASLFNPALVIPPLSDGAGSYGGATTNAVREYKRQRDVVRPGQPLDPICGRGTITALDNDLLQIEGAPPPPAPEPPAPSVEILDVVVQITGFGGPNSPNQGAKQGGGALRALVASPTYLAKPGRKLSTIVFTGGQEPSPNRAIALEITTALANRKAGKVCLFGASAGGKNVLALAADLNASSLALALDYVGVSDGAFFDDDAVAPPNFSGDNLLIKRPNFTAARTVNVFQSAGNDTHLSIRHARKFWQGKMPNHEVHGPISGFQVNQDVQSSADGPNINWEIVHANAAGKGDAQHVAAIRAILDGA